MLIFAYIWVLCLLPLPWLVRKFFPPKRTSVTSVHVPFGDRIQAAATGLSSAQKVSQSWLPQLVPWLIWGLLIFAMARPQWLEPPLEKIIPTRDLLLLVDLSGSMQQEDFTNAAGKKVDRLSAVKDVLGDFLLRREGDRVGLVVFGDSPFLQAPFSTDLSLSEQLLEETQIGMAGPRTALGDAIGLGLNLFDESDAPAKTIIALTDGNDTKSQVPPIEAARVAKERDIRIHTVAIGDPTTIGEEKLDEETLKSVAKTAGGSYFFAGDREQLEGIYKELDSIETRDIKTVSHRPRLDLFYWPVLLALVFSLFDRLIAVLKRNKANTLTAKSRRVRVHPTTGKLEVLA